MAQVPAQPEPWLWIFHDRPAFFGSRSLSCAPLAPPEPEFQTVMVKPIWPPAITVPASAVLRMWMDAPATQVDALSESEPSFAVFTKPVLSMTPSPSGQSPPVAAVVVDVTCTVNVLAPCVVPAGTVP